MLRCCASATFPAKSHIAQHASKACCGCRVTYLLLCNMFRRSRKKMLHGLTPDEKNGSTFTISRRTPFCFQTLFSYSSLSYGSFSLLSEGYFSGMVCFIVCRFADWCVEDTNIPVLVTKMLLETHKDDPWKGCLTVIVPAESYPFLLCQSLRTKQLGNTMGFVLALSIGRTIRQNAT